MCPPPTSAPPSFYDGKKYDLAGSVGHCLMHLMMLMRREVEARMAQHGLTDAQWKPLWMLKTGRAATAFELAREMMVDAGAITRMLDRLEAKGLVERVRSETDRRVVDLRLTPAGEAAVENVPHVLAAVNNDFLRGFSKQEFQQLRGFIERMTTNGQALQEAQATA
jgi:DNA-binding MarR family transcriptional regulator